MKVTDLHLSDLIAATQVIVVVVHILDEVTQGVAIPKVIKLIQKADIPILIHLDTRTITHIRMRKYSLIS